MDLPTILVVGTSVTSCDQLCIASIHNLVPLFTMSDEDEPEVIIAAPQMKMRIAQMNLRILVTKRIHTR